ASLAADAAQDGLAILGAFHPGPADGAPAGTGTLVLLGPDGARFWARLQAASEWRDGAPDPIDRWSARVIGALAARHGAAALLPFGVDPPWPFWRWAVASGRCWPSPVRLLVHERQGLWVSFRGALALPEAVPLPLPPEAAPCARCADRPCLSACPAAALGAAGYDLAACHRWLDRPEGRACLEAGCRVRAACPVSRRFDRPPAQSAWHMRHFHPPARRDGTPG
ncbi:MAG: ferredoxin, partial [Alphaproteobacteria bacterium]